MTEVVEVETVEKETAYQFGDWTIMEGYTDALYLRNQKVAICLLDVSSTFWFNMNGEEIHTNVYASPSSRKSSTALRIAKFIMREKVKLRKPVFTTPSEKFILVWHDWEISSKKYGELLITHNKECQIMIKNSSTDIHTTVKGVQWSYFDQDE